MEPILLRWCGLLALSLWVGGGAAIAFLAAPVVFERAESRTRAGEMVGGMLRRYERMVLFCILVSASSAGLGAVFFRTRAAALQVGVVGVMAGLALVSQRWVGPRIAALRAEMGEVSAVARDDPRRRRFGRLHGVSVLLLMGQLLLGALALALALV
jgi:uncharacterized membrane protein